MSLIVRLALQMLQGKALCRRLTEPGHMRCCCSLHLHTQRCLSESTRYIDSACTAACNLRWVRPDGLKPTNLI